MGGVSKNVKLLEINEAMFLIERKRSHSCVGGIWRDKNKLCPVEFELEVSTKKSWF